MIRYLLSNSKAVQHYLKHWLLMVVCLILTYRVDGQTVINAGPDQNITCGASATLTAQVTQAPLSTSTYNISTTAYNPDPFNQGTQITMGDDVVNGPYNIGFNFCYYGNNYSSFYIGSNNWIGFSPGQTATWMTIPIPTTGAAPRNCIMGPWQDIHPGLGGQIRYQVYGTAPFRRLVVTYNQIPMFSCTGLIYTSQIKIYETTNVIETHIASKPVCPGWNSGRAVHGLHNINGTQATIVAGRNNTQWTATNECTRFTPNGAPNFTVTWVNTGTNTVVGTGTSINVTPTVTTTYSARVNLVCGNQSVPIDTDLVTINVPIPPTSTFTIPNQVCANTPTTITYTGNATPGGTYNWNFGTGTVISGTGQGPYQVSFPTSGNQTVSLTVNDFTCNSTPTNQTINILPSPTASINAPPNVCNPDTVLVQFNGVAGNGATYNWNFGGGNVITGTGQGPYQIYWPNNGTTAITLAVTENGCTSPIDTAIVNVYLQPNANYTVTNGVCGNAAATITYTGNAPANATYNWNFSGGSVVSGTGQGPYQVSWNTPGTYNVTLLVQNGTCNSFTNQQFVTVYNIPTATFALQANGCTGDTISINYTGNATNAATYAWNFNGGTIISGTGQGPYQVVWNTPGAKDVALNVTQNGCSSGAVTNTININQTPNANFTAQSGICQGFPSAINYTGNATGAATYTWGFNGGTVQNGAGQGPYNIIWNNTGNYTVTLNVTENGCSATQQSQPVQVLQVPTASFILPSTVCGTDTVTINFTGFASPSANYNWNLAGGVVVNGTGQGPYSVYWPTTGVKNLSLQIDQSGCISNNATGQTTVYQQPTATFSVPSQMCEDTDITLTYTGNATNGATYTWNLGGAAIVSGTGQGPFTLNWPTAGATNVSLQVVENGCSTTVNTTPIMVYAIPTAQITAPANACQNQLTGVSYSGTASPNATYNWSFDSPTAQTGVGVGPYSITWSTQGNKAITLTVTENGCTSPQAQATIMINTVPIINAGLDVTICSGDTVQIGDVTSTGFTYQWTPSTGLNNANIAAPTALLTTTGLPQTVTYVIEADNGGFCFAYDTVEVSVTPLPIANFTTPVGQCIYNANFNLQAIGTFSNAAQYTWNTVGANVATYATQNINCSYASPGSYPISLSIVDNGCTSETFIDSVNVYPQPVAAFTPSVIQGCAPLAVTFTNQSTAPGSTLTKYDWSFGSTQQEPSYVFDEGIYTITLIIGNAFGCTDTMELVNGIEVYSLPVAGFVASPDVVDVVLNPVVSIQDISSGGQTYFYDMGDGLNNPQTSPYFDYVYSKEGDITITQIITNAFGCTDTAYQNIQVKPSMSVYIPNAFTPNSDTKNDEFGPQGMELEDYMFSIYNRWGQLMFRTTNPNLGWDGKFGGTPSPGGVYTWILEYNSAAANTKGKQTQRGTVTLIR